MLDSVKITFANGDVIITDYNAAVDREEVAKYYFGKIFNVGNRENLQKCVKVEFDF